MYKVPIYTAMTINSFSKSWISIFPDYANYTNVLTTNNREQNKETKLFFYNIYINASYLTIFASHYEPKTYQHIQILTDNKKKTKITQL